MSGINPTFTVNDFNKAKFQSETETYVNDFLMLLFGRPGFYPSIPSIGIDIRNYLYRFEDDIDVEEIKAKVATQCKDFLPMIREGDFDVMKTTYNDHTLLAFILPPIKSEDVAIAIGITTNNKGEVIYNFIENKQQEL